MSDRKGPYKVFRLLVDVPLRPLDKDDTFMYSRTGIVYMMDTDIPEIADRVKAILGFNGFDVDNVRKPHRLWSFELAGKKFAVWFDGKTQLLNCYGDSSILSQVFGERYASCS